MIVKGRAAHSAAEQGYTSGMTGILLYLSSAAAYAALTLGCVRALRHNSPSPLNAQLRAILAAALCLHALSLGDALFGGGGLRFGLGASLSLTLWLAMLFYFLESFIARLDGLPAIAAPVAALCALLPWFIPGKPLPDDLSDWAFRAHVIVAMLAYSLFTLAALHALLMAIAEKQLHNTRQSPRITGLPPLLVLENLLFRLIGTAFVLLTLTVISGVFFSEQLFGRALVWNHKTIFTIAAWLLFGILLIGRHTRGWRGRTAQRWTLAGFVCLLLAYAGTRFVLEVVLQRT